MTGHHAPLLAELLSFVRDEQVAAHRSLLEVWARPIHEKLLTGWSQAFTRLEPGETAGTVWAWLGAGDSRFREGDFLALHLGRPTQALLARGYALEREEDDRWLLRGAQTGAVLDALAGGPCYADPDAIDLTSYYERTLEEIADSTIGREFVLPLLAGELPISFDDRDVTEAEQAARAAGFNARQALATGLAVGAEQIACIQGPPGTGKTRVLALIVRLLVERGERVLVTSHTHTAINNALNQVHAQGVPTVKIGRDTQCRGLDDAIGCHANLGEWEARPTNGYAVGATPFATCTARLEGCEFDTIVFDEASQITVPLALMAMRKGRRYLFIGDPRQLPPVVLSRSVLSERCLSVFAALTSRHADHTVMLDQTYRMNRWLTAWPSRAYYEGRLVAAGPNAERRLALAAVPERYAAVLDGAASGIFIATLDRSARTRNLRDAELVADLCSTAVGGGLALEAIGIVTPYRAQGRIVRDLLSRRFGRSEAGKVVSDTVERMQGQERELIILTLATGDPVFLGAVAAFLFQPERLNVAITRAKTKLIVIGPAPASLPRVEHETVARWIAGYVDLIGHLTQVDMTAPEPGAGASSRVVSRTADLEP